MNERLKQKVRTAIEALTLGFVLILAYIYIIQPVLVTVTPMGADSSLSKILLYVTAVGGVFIFGMFRDVIVSWLNRVIR